MNQNKREYHPQPCPLTEAEAHTGTQPHPRTGFILLTPRQHSHIHSPVPRCPLPSSKGRHCQGLAFQGMAFQGKAFPAQGSPPSPAQGAAGAGSGTKVIPAQGSPRRRHRHTVRAQRQAAGPSKGRSIAHRPPREARARSRPWHRDTPGHREGLRRRCPPAGLG